MRSLKGKKIVLAMINDLGFYQSFIDNLRHLGLDIHILTNPLKFKYKNIFYRLTNVYMRLVKKDKTYKKKLKAEYEEDQQLKLLDSITGKVDFFLSIRPDVFSKRVIDKAVSKSKKSYGYQWDGLSQFPDVVKLISSFDKFYMFDSNDVKFKNTALASNFYFDCYEDLRKNAVIKYDVYYVGCYDDRINDIIEVCSELYKMGLKMKIIIPCSKRKQKILKKHLFFSFPEKAISYKENLLNVFSSRIILDFGHKKIHNGLSFRPYEAIGYQKKIITTNKLITSYDLYNESNVFLYNKTNTGLSEFVNSGYNKMDERIVHKYSFSNWIKNILEV